MTQKQNQAIDLMIEDLYTIHTDIRSQAKELGCEDELNTIKNSVLDYLRQIKINIQN
jgi:hypothetical protein